MWVCCYVLRLCGMLVCTPADAHRHTIVRMFRLSDLTMYAQGIVSHTIVWMFRLSDPTMYAQGIVSQAAVGSGKTVWGSARLPYSEWLTENPPVFRDRESKLDAAFKVSSCSMW
jgi:hypothetical protein